MKSWAIQEFGSVDGLQLIDRPDRIEEDLLDCEVLVRVRAVSLNYRDLITLQVERPGNLPPPLTPCSDGAGEVVAVGTGVQRWRAGDRVAGTFFQDWTAGGMTKEVMKTALGGSLPGVLSEYVVLREDGLVRIPEHLSYEEASTLPCAAVTAWNCLVETSPLLAGETVLLLGTGGVSIFALQFAKLHGARVIITSSSDQKLERARQLGADETINYREHPDWEKQVYALTGKNGADVIVEVGGAGTLEKSLESVRYGGRISLIGVLSGFEGRVNPWPFVAKSARLQGIYVGSREMFLRMNSALSLHELRPVIDRVFPFSEAPEAFRALQQAGHFGKLVISVP